MAQTSESALKGQHFKSKPSLVQFLSLFRQLKGNTVDWVADKQKRLLKVLEADAQESTGRFGVLMMAHFTDIFSCVLTWQKEARKLSQASLLFLVAFINN